jgi:hypothetical protein
VDEELMGMIEYAEAAFTLGEPMKTQHRQHLRQLAQQAFERDLPKLLKTHPGQWVAYQGDQQLLCAPHTHEVYEECFQQGLTSDQFMIFEIGPDVEEVRIGPMSFDCGSGLRS